MDTRTDEEILQDLNKSKIYDSWFVLAFCAILIIAGILGNTASIVFFGFKLRKTTTNFLITWLSATDLTACILFCTLIVTVCFSLNFKDKYACKFMYFFNHWAVNISSFLLLAIGVDRFRKICRPLEWQFTLKTTKVCISVIFLSTFLGSVRNFVAIDIVSMNVTDPDSGQQIEAHHCTHTKDQDFKTLVLAFHLYDLAVISLLIVSLIVIYTIIAMDLWRHRQNKLRNNCKGLQYKRKEESHTKEDDLSESSDKTECNDEKELKISNEREIQDTVEHVAAADNTSTGTKQDISVDIEASIMFRKHGVNDRKDDTNIVPTAMEETCDVEEDKYINPGSKRSTNVETKVTIMMLAITIVSILSFVPHFIVTFTSKQSTKISEYEFDAGIQLALRSFLLNNAINPYITGIINSEFRLFAKESLVRFLLRARCDCFRC